MVFMNKLRENSKVIVFNLNTTFKLKKCTTKDICNCQTISFSVIQTVHINQAHIKNAHFSF